MQLFYYHYERRKWAIVLATVLLFACQMVLVYSNPSCPDKEWNFVTQPDRCITSVTFRKHGEENGPKRNFTSLRMACLERNENFYKIDLLTIPDEPTFKNICRVLKPDIPYAIGLRQKPGFYEYYWLATLLKATYLPWRNNNPNYKVNCVNIYKATDNSPCEFIPISCEAMGYDGLCSTYYLNPCDEDNGACGSGYTCRYKGPMSRNCLDINECRDPKNVCGKSCVNTIGSYYCNCTAVSMVKEMNHDPSTGACKCNSGFKLAKDGNTCECPDAQQTIKGGKCMCGGGYLTTNDGCDDVNECQDENTNCSQKCVNTIGSYHCDCTGPYFVEGKREKNNPQCVCERGYQLNENADSCIDYDECFHNGQSMCNDDQYCLNTEGNYTCCHSGNDRKNDKLCRQTAAAKQEESGGSSDSNPVILVGVSFLIVGLAAVALFAAKKMKDRKKKGGDEVEKEENEEDEDDAEIEENVEAEGKEQGVGENLDDVSIGTDIDVADSVAK